MEMKEEETKVTPDKIQQLLDRAKIEQREGILSVLEPEDLLQLIQERAILMGFVAQHLNMGTPGAKEIWEKVTQ